LFSFSKPWGNEECAVDLFVERFDQWARVNILGALYSGCHFLISSVVWH